MIVKEGDNTVDMYIVLKGKVKLSVYPSSEIHRVLFHYLLYFRNLMKETNLI